MKQSRRGPVNTAFVVLTALCLALLAVACGGNTDGNGVRHATPATPTAVLHTPTAVATPSEPGPTEFRVAFINLHSPLLQELGDGAVAATFNQRLKMIIEELRAFAPDVVGFNEAFWTPDFPEVVATLGGELGMIPCFQRANPWYPTQTREESNALAVDVGFEEGELLLVRNVYNGPRPCDRYPIQPLTTEAGEGRIGIHWIVKGPSAFGGDGEIDVFITHLKGGGDTIRAQQAADFVDWVSDVRGSGPSIVFVGQDDPASASNYDAYRSIALRDAFTAEEVLTCCRATVVGEQQPMTARNDYLLYDRMQVISAVLLGVNAGTLADGTPVYASDHLGFAATFAVPPERPSSLP